MNTLSATKLNRDPSSGAVHIVRATSIFLPVVVLQGCIGTPSRPPGGASIDRSRPLWDDSLSEWSAQRAAFEPLRSLLRLTKPRFSLSQPTKLSAIGSSRTSIRTTNNWRLS